MAQTLNNFSAPSEDWGHITAESVSKQARELRRQRSLLFCLRLKLKTVLLERCLRLTKDVRERTDLQLKLLDTLKQLNYSKSLRKSWHEEAENGTGKQDEKA